jgi:hypothetical protein
MYRAGGPLIRRLRSGENHEMANYCHYFNPVFPNSQSGIGRPQTSQHLRRSGYGKSSGHSISSGQKISSHTGWSKSIIMQILCGMPQAISYVLPV